MRPILFSIHGIRTTGAWQDGAASVVDQLFDYRRLRYTEYRKAAILKLSGDLIFLLLGMVGLYVCWRRHWFTNPTHRIVFTVLLATGFLLIHVLGHSRMMRLISNIHHGMTDTIAIGHTPSIVAHSLGTFVVCSIFEKYEDMSLHTLMLDGCVVRRSYPWSRMVLRFERVFNEIGGMDPVPWAAGFLRFTMRGMGTAGARGFKGEAVTTDMMDPAKMGPVLEGKGSCCSLHSQAFEVDRPVQNIRHRRLRHSDYHEGVSHARGFWLPRLLGYDPVLYRKFYEACRSVVSAENGLVSERREAMQSLRQDCWGWTMGSLESFTETELKLLSGGLWTGDQIEELVNVSVYNLCLLTSEAVDNFYKQPPSASGEQWRFLDPKTALHLSIVASVTVARQHGIVL
jgi:hypothetical protein